MNNIRKITGKMPTFLYQMTSVAISTTLGHEHQCSINGSHVVVVENYYQLRKFMCLTVLRVLP